MKSIKEVAQLYNVSTNTIAYHMKRNDLTIHIQNSKRFITDKDTQQLSNYITTNKTTTSNTSNESHTTSNTNDSNTQHTATSNTDTNELLQHIQTLKQQLTVKDNQIASQQKTIDKLSSDTTQALLQAQALQLRQLGNDTDGTTNIGAHSNIGVPNKHTDVTHTHTDTNSSSNTTQNTDVANSTYDDTTQDDTITNGNSGNVSDQTDKSNDTNTDQTDTNIEDTESNKRKGFFARLFNL